MSCYNTALQSNGSTSSLPPLYYLLANIQIARARAAPKLILQDARQDNMTREKQRDTYYKDAIQFLNQGDKADSGEGISPMLMFLTRGMYFLFICALGSEYRIQLFTN